MSESRVEYGERRAICPLMSVPVEGVDCMRERCAWWTGTECAVAIAKRGRGIDVMTSRLLSGAVEFGGGGGRDAVRRPGKTGESEAVRSLAHAREPTCREN